MLLHSQGLLQLCAQLLWLGIALPPWIEPLCRNCSMKSVCAAWVESYLGRGPILLLLWPWVRSQSSHGWSKAQCHCLLSKNDFIFKVCVHGMGWGDACECRCHRGYSVLQLKLASNSPSSPPKRTSLACAFKYWDYRQGPPRLVCAGLGIGPRASDMLGRHCAHQTTPSPSSRLFLSLQSLWSHSCFSDCCFGLCLWIRSCFLMRGLGCQLLTAGHLSG